MKSISFRIQKAILACALLAGVVFVAHAYIEMKNVQKLKSLAALKIPELEHLKAIEIEALNAERGDYVLRYHKPPFAVRKWTLNTFTGHVIPWQPPLKKPH